MSSSLVVLAVVIALLASRKRKLLPVTGRRFLAVFAAILILHVMVISGLMFFYHFSHS